MQTLCRKVNYSYIIGSETAIEIDAYILNIPIKSVNGF